MLTAPVFQSPRSPSSVLGLKAIVVEHRCQQVWPLLLPMPVQARWFASQLEEGPLGAMRFCFTSSQGSTCFPDQVAQIPVFSLADGWGSKEEMNLEA